VRLNPATRALAGKRLIALSDVQFDQPVAAATHEQLLRFCEPGMANDPSFLSASIIYHTTFGEPAKALALIEEITAASHSLSLEDRQKSLRDNAGLALNRLGHYARARDVSVGTFEHMMARGVLSSAELSLSTITDAEICLGNWEGARIWMQQWQDIAVRKAMYQSRFVSCYFSIWLLLTLHSGDFAEAERALSSLEELGLNNTARYRAITLAYAILIKYWSDDRVMPQTLTSELRGLYDRGRALGSQDVIVEALWCAAMRDGRPDEASRILSDYLTVYRREKTPPEWNLRQTTCQDPAWGTYHLA
jgi:hypothetical protein